MIRRSEEACKKALDKCSAILEELNLRIYPAKSVVSYGAEYYVAKSKGPFLWGNPSVIPCAIPWVSFLGYSIRYDGSTRLRKETLLAHAKSIREECASFLLDAKRFGFRKPKNKSQAVEDFLCRLMAKGTGRINVEPIKGLGRCWLSVFRFVCQNISQTTAIITKIKITYKVIFIRLGISYYDRIKHLIDYIFSLSQFK